MKMAEMFSKRTENTRKRRFLLIMSNFSFSHSVFKRIVLQTRKNHGLFGKGLICQESIRPEKATHLTKAKDIAATTGL